MAEKIFEAKAGDAYGRSYIYMECIDSLTRKELLALEIRQYEKMWKISRLLSKR